MSKQKHGFTLLELMTVMVIMFMLLGLSTLALRGMIRGAGMSGAVQITRAALTQARQNAIMSGRPTTVIVTSESLLTVARYGVIEGLSFAGNQVIFEQDLSWSESMMQGNHLYNMRLGVYSIIDSNNPQENEYRVFGIAATPPVNWQQGDWAGFATGQERRLPPGYVFRGLGGERLIITFTSEGRLRGNANVSFRIEEELGAANPMPVSVVALTGRVSVD